MKEENLEDNTNENKACKTKNVSVYKYFIFINIIWILFNSFSFINYRRKWLKQ